MKLLHSFLILLVMASCNTEEVGRDVSLYFDLEDYVGQLSSDQKTFAEVNKIVKLDQQEESKKISTYDLSDELNMMKKYNINKAALAGKYKVEESDTEVVYTALEDGLSTSLLRVRKSKDQVSAIEITGLQKSILSESRQTIIFAPERSFLLKSEDNNKFTKDITKEVLIEIIKN